MRGRKPERRHIAQADAPVRPPAHEPQPGQASLDWTDRAIARALAWEQRHLVSQTHLSLPPYPSPSTPPIPKTKLADKW